MRAKAFIMSLWLLLLSIFAFAQDKKVDINVNTKSGNDNFFMQPWVWIVGGAIFILLLVALLRGNRSRD
jgi:cell division protein FtsW (lipid II flippase)